MPELPEVETTRRGLLKAVKDARIVRAEQRRADLRVPFPPLLPERLQGAKILNVRRRAKYLLIDLDDGNVMLAHLGMSGSFTVRGEGALKKHDHLVLHLDNEKRAIFHDPRRFGVIDLFPRAQEKTHPLLTNLGPEPLSKAFSAAYLKAALARRSGPVKPALMDQKLVVGVGNIYASESLFHAGIHPAQKVSISAGKSAKLVPCIQSTLKAAIASGGSSLRDFVGAGGDGGHFQHKFFVYGRDGKSCFNCGTTIQHLVQAGRSTYFCPHCQPIRALRQKT